MTSNFEKIAKKYAQAVDSKPIHIYYERPNFLSLMPRDLQNLNILDLGCGSGWYAEHFVKLGANVTAMDASQTMVTLTKQRVPNCEVYCADLEEPLDFLEANRFNIIVAPLVIHYVKDWYRLFAQLSKLLKSNGHFILSTHSPHNEYILFKLENYFEKQLITDYWENIGEFPHWVSAKDIILEMLRRHTVKGGVGYIIEYYGPALKQLNAMDRHVIANMGAELGATATVFPSDEITKIFLQDQNRSEDWIELKADQDANYDKHDEINLSELEPLIAKPSNPDKVVKVREIAGEPIFQAYIGSSANPGFRDFAISAAMVKGKKIPTQVSFDINPTSRNSLEELIREGYMADLIHAGARLHQAGCNGCIGMGQAPATEKNSLRTTPRNFPGRSGTLEDKVFLCSPETATASALMGVITDPRDLNLPYPEISYRGEQVTNKDMLQPPVSKEQAIKVNLIKGPNIKSIPHLVPIADSFSVPVLLKVGNNISTDEILPAGARVLPYRSNIPKISEFVYDVVDDTYAKRAKELSKKSGHIIIGGENYGQGSSREHAALAPRYLGLQMVIAKSFARIHWQNLINFGILPVTFMAPGVYDEIEQEDIVQMVDIAEFLKKGKELTVNIANKNKQFQVKHDLSPRQVEIILAGGLINWIKNQE